MAVTTEIPWGDGTSGKIYLTRDASEGNQTVLVSSDANTGAARSKVVTFSAPGASPVTLTVNQAAAALPYDARVEYIASDGGQYIDTGIECTGDLSVEFRAYWTTTDNSAICGGVVSTGGSNYFRHHLTPRWSANQNFYFYQNNNSSNASVRASMGSANAWHTFKLDASTGAWDLNLGGRTGSVTPLSGSLTTGKSWGIMARISSDGTLNSKPSRWDWCKLSRGGVLLRDYIAVRVGQVGYFYDKVSGQLFGNAGTGNFTIGNDVNE